MRSIAVFLIGLACVLGLATFSKAATTDPPESVVPREGIASQSNDAPQVSAQLLHERCQVEAPVAGRKINPLFSLGIRGSFILRENDLKLATDVFPDFAAGLFFQYQPGHSHRLRMTGEWWDFSPAVQTSVQTSRTQTINTQVRAIISGAEYLYRLPGPVRRFSVGGGAYLARWSVYSIDTVTLIPGGSTQAKGTSQWNRLGVGGITTFRLSHWLELEGRWVHSSYGFEHLPVNVITLGFGWKF